MFFKKKKKIIKEDVVKEEIYEPIPPGTKGFASIHICPKCGKEVVKTQANCPYCNEIIFNEDDFNFKR